MCQRNGAPNTNECQFYITTFAPITHMDKRTVAFGRVVDGFDAIMN